MLSFRHAIDFAVDQRSAHQELFLRQRLRVTHHFQGKFGSTGPQRWLDIVEIVEMESQPFVKPNPSAGHVIFRKFHF